MEKITHSHVQNLIDKLPEQKLTMAYNILKDLVKKEQIELSPQMNIMLLPINERRKLLLKQAKQMSNHYKVTDDERQMWQSGDFLDEY